jgi:hypothetical protein
MFAPKYKYVENIICPGEWKRLSLPLGGNNQKAERRGWSQEISTKREEKSVLKNRNQC